MQGESANLAGFHEVTERADEKQLEEHAKPLTNKDQQLKWRRVTRMKTLRALQKARIGILKDDKRPWSN